MNFGMRSATRRIRVSPRQLWLLSWRSADEVSENRRRNYAEKLDDSCGPVGRPYAGLISVPAGVAGARAKLWVSNTAAIGADSRHQMRRFIAGAIAAGVVFLSLPTMAGAASSTVDGWGNFGNESLATHVDVPPSVTLPSAPSQLQASNSNDYALVDGSVWAWGYGSAGELGTAAAANSIDTPVEADFPPGVTVTDIGDSMNSGYAVDSDGNGWAWGSDKSGDHCMGGKRQNVPTEITGLPAVTATSGGQQHSLWLAANGTVWSCGLNKVGQLGDGTFTSSATPVEATGLSDVVAISSGNQTSAALTADGDLYTWGQGGDTGNGTKANVDVPTQVPGTFSQVYSGGSLPVNGNTLALTASGQVEAWGAGYTNAPEVLSLPFTTAFVMAGGSMDGALDSSGNVWIWKEGKPYPAAIVATGTSLLSGTADNAIAS